MTLVKDTRAPVVSLDGAKWSGVRAGRVEVPLVIHERSQWRLRVGTDAWTDWMEADRTHVMVPLESRLPILNIRVQAEDRLGNGAEQTIMLPSDADLPDGVVSAGKNKRGFEEFRAASAPGVRFVRIPAMRVAFRPGKWVQVPGFFIAKHELSEKQFLASARKLGIRRPARPPLGYYEDAKRTLWPIVGLTLPDAKRVCAALGCRLPTAMEWRAASLAGRVGAAPWGASSKPTKEFKNRVNMGEKWARNIVKEGAEASGYGVFRNVTDGYESSCGCVHLYGNASEMLEDGTTAGWSAGDPMLKKWPARFGGRRPPSPWVGVRLVLNP